MLNTSYLASLPEGLVELYSQLESDIISDIAKRLKKLGKVTDATLWQAKIFQEAGGLQSDVVKWLDKYDKQGKKELLALFNEALEKSAAKDVAQLNKAGLSDSQQQILDATVKKVASSGIVSGSKKVKEDAEQGFIKMWSSVQRATMTIASSSSNEFVQQANRLYMATVSGAFDYNTSLIMGIKELGQKGIETVEYTDSGKPFKRSIEGMLRTNIMTGINQTATRVTLDNCKDLECDLVEVSAHMGARPEHEAWQGKIYSLNPDNKKYPYFYTVCRYGEPDGICGINCRHSFYPYFEGVEPMYSKDELDEYKDARVSYTIKGKDGKEIKRTVTLYEAEQKQRFLERQIRKAKREVAGLEEVDKNAPETLFARNKLFKAQQTMREYIDQTGLRRDSAREYIGTTDGKQPRGLKEYIKPNDIDITKWGDYVKSIDLKNTKIADSMTFEQADNGKPNPNFDKEGGRTNCQTCVASFFARTLGYDVQARTRLNNVYMNKLAYETNLAYTDIRTGERPKYIYPKKKTKEDLFDWLYKNINENQLHTFQFSWKGEKDGHIVNLWKNPNGNLIIYDPQPNKRSISKNLNIQDFYFGSINIESVKLINLKGCILNEDFVKHILEKSK